MRRARDRLSAPRLARDGPPGGGTRLRHLLRPLRIHPLGVLLDAHLRTAPALPGGAPRHPTRPGGDAGTRPGAGRDRRHRADRRRPGGLTAPPAAPSRTPPARPSRGRRLPADRGTREAPGGSRTVRRFRPPRGREGTATQHVGVLARYGTRCMLIPLSPQGNPVGIRSCPATVCGGLPPCRLHRPAARHESEDLPTVFSHVRASWVGPADAHGHAPLRPGMPVRPSCPPDRGAAGPRGRAPS